MGLRVKNRLEMEVEEEWDKWRDVILRSNPLKFKEGWSVFVIPPEVGAIARFVVKKGDVSLSVYLDCLERLGYVGGPYYEVYPIGGEVSGDNKEDWPRRYLLGEEEEMMKEIEESLGQ